MDSSALKGLPLFADLSEDELERCAALFQEQEVLTGTNLAAEGDFAYKFFLVVDGNVEVRRDGERVANLGPGDYFGEMGVSGDERRNADVVAENRCQLAWIMPWDYQQLTESMPTVASRIEATIAERMAQLPGDEG